MGWFGYPYSYPYSLWRYAWFPWQPIWWTGLYGRITPYAVPKELEIAMLENQKKWMEEALERIKKRLEELKGEKE